MLTKWDRKYQAADKAGNAAKVLTENIQLLPVVKKGKALDVACGLGANSLLLAEHGLDVSAWDSSVVAIEKLTKFAKHHLLSISGKCRDVSLNPPEPDTFDVIVVSFFLDRGLCKKLIEALKPGGLIFYQTYCQQKVTEIGPTNPDFLLKENELLHLFSGLNIRFYREDALVGDIELGFRNQAMLIAQKPM
jgi:2-polyprenyl-3-methyl-5-hydroxy-6-metoxy-1,4-benzoquinol methylase